VVTTWPRAPGPGSFAREALLTQRQLSPAADDRRMRPAQLCANSRHALRIDLSGWFAALHGITAKNKKTAKITKCTMP
jgi:hypothetical protein